MGKNVVLIGMPGSGKTVTGKALAEMLGYGFVDTDDVMVEKLGKTLPDVVSEHGPGYFIKAQDEIIVSLDFSDTVISTGGSVVCSSAAINHLRQNGVVVYLKMGLRDLEDRLPPGRKLARDNSQTLKDIYKQRSPLYEKYSDIVIECGGRAVEDIAGDIALKIGQGKG